MQTPLQITFKNLESSDFLDDMIRDRAQRLERFHDGIISCRVVVEVPHRSGEGRKSPIGITVEVNIPNHATIVAREQEERREVKNDHLAAISHAFDHVERQLTDAMAIQSREVKQHEGEGETGLVVRLFPLQSYGFIQVRGSPDLYFTRNAVIGSSYDDLEVGTLVQVTRATGEGPMGPQASSVRALSAPQSPG